MVKVDSIQSYLNLKIGLPPVLKAGSSGIYEMCNIRNIHNGSLNFFNLNYYFRSKKLESIKKEKMRKFNYLSRISKYDQRKKISFKNKKLSAKSI
jgi:hypothetical protein